MKGKLQMADSNRGFRRTALEHMDDMTNDFATLTQRRYMERPYYRIERETNGFPKPASNDE
jgi:hypothetical protein